MKTFSAERANSKRERKKSLGDKKREKNADGSLVGVRNVYAGLHYSMKFFGRYFRLLKYVFIKYKT